MRVERARQPFAEGAWIALTRVPRHNGVAVPFPQTPTGPISRTPHPAARTEAGHRGPAERTRTLHGDRRNKAYRDRVAIVTGAASGIGRALCDELARRGACVVPVDRDTRGLAETVASLEQADAGTRVLSAEVDVTDRDAVGGSVERVVAAKGRLDFLFNNAGIGVGGEARDYSYRDWKQVIDVNLYGVIHGVHAAYPVMVRQGFGHIVNVSSLAGLIPLSGEISYTRSRHRSTRRAGS